MRVFEKRLSPSERARHWVIVPVADRENLPPCNEPFQIKAGSETVRATVDSNNRILGLGFAVFDALDLDHLGASVVLEKTSEEGYVLKKK
jgi:hypothetical protein